MYMQHKSWHLYKWRKGLNNVIEIHLLLWCRFYASITVNRKCFTFFFFFFFACFFVLGLCGFWFCFFFLVWHLVFGGGVGFFLFCFKYSSIFSAETKLLLGLPIQFCKGIVIYWQIPLSKGQMCCSLSFKQKKIWLCMYCFAFQFKDEFQWKQAS